MTKPFMAAGGLKLRLKGNLKADTATPSLVYLLNSAFPVAPTSGFHSANFLWTVIWSKGSENKGILALKFLAKKSKGLVPAGVFYALLGSKLVLATKFADFIFERRHFNPKVGVKPGISGTLKLPSDILMRHSEFPL